MLDCWIDLWLSLLSLPPQELEQHERLYQFKVDDLLQQHQLERRRYPRQLKVDHKNHMAELKRSNRGRTDTTTLRQVRLLPWQTLYKSATVLGCHGNNGLCTV